MINFLVSPFEGGCQFKNQTVLSNLTMYLTYRDENGKYLGSDDIGGPIEMNFTIPNLKEREAKNIACSYIGA